MTEISSLCVFCGSKMGADEAYADAARALGREIAQRGVNLVYGGGGIGIMGILAHTVLAEGGTVTGVIPHFIMELEVGDPGLTELILVDNMHDRKRKMFELSDGFITLPGGLGTLDETFEIITWKQLRQHSKPIVVLNAGGYWDPFKGMVEKIIDQDFAHAAAAELFTVVDTPAEVFPALADAPEPQDVVLTDHL
ncbi:MAG: TIGR00730 family Rossman fold protein [Rhodospirillales bacterium]|nr:TIGR00730 family Rossman fold protein [Rhodospirillales bacterium]